MNDVNFNWQKEVTKAKTPAITQDDLALISQLCLPYKIISQNMGIDKLTLGMRIHRLESKLGVETSRALMIKALELGLLTVDQFVYRKYDKRGNPLDGKN